MCMLRCETNIEDTDGHSIRAMFASSFWRTFISNDEQCHVDLNVKTMKCSPHSFGTLNPTRLQAMSSMFTDSVAARAKLQELEKENAKTPHRTAQYYMGPANTLYLHMYTQQKVYVHMRCI